MKHKNEKNIETQQWHTAMKSSNRTTMKTTMKHMNEKQQSYNNRSTMKNPLITPMKHKNET